MNNKPVAWMCKSGFEYQQVKENFSYKEKEGWIPLYTHPPAQQWTIEAKFKELTDEEIMDIWCSTKDYDSQSEEALNFAKAILRKAQNK